MGNWKSMAKHALVVLVIVAGAAYLARNTTFGKKVFSTSAV